MPQRTKVAIVGASGDTGSSVVQGLLSQPDQFDLVAFARVESLEKDEYARLRERGASVLPIDLKGPITAVVELLKDFDVVISCMTLLSYEDERNLILAASIAKVGRYVPSFFGPCCPPRGVMGAREKKEDLLDLIKLHYLPYTIIDVGWWYQLSLPELPSGRLTVQAEISNTEIIGDGNTSMALIDNRDIGKFVARIIVDPRTKNKHVFCYGEVMCQNEIFDILENLSGERISRHQLPAETLTKQIGEALAELAKNPTDPQNMLVVGMGQYRQLLGVRGDNTPQKARYLNYLDGKEMYPDVRITPLKEYIEDALAGKATVPRSRR
ncbi:hypothetical protein PFICI_01594 [Pestalotiopsis fici W106-1]|uniref:NmrA-like domain-containing protein n=1 Tax=Pestalotiopsis fici (strain W106-1 / CGMCC3.15140) TaxID=1229662 RepID=W3XRD6_PESFW|nr:uncharacterized protein PFICI_01594 [Pestalotiopsis fici W106-1]ETS87766.1 hypothetical protein PFICI_01594 [Pestalotiopsis fici W106-1]